MIMGVMSDLDIEFHNVPNTVKYLRHEIERLERLVKDILKLVMKVMDVVGKDIFKEGKTDE